MELIKLIGILVVVVGFALKLNSLAIILAAGIITGLVSGVPFKEILEAFGAGFVGNRTMCMFIVVMLLTGTLERNGLKVVAERLVKKIKGVTPGIVIGVNTILRGFQSAINVGFGGVPGFVKPVIMPMAEGAIPEDIQDREGYTEELKGMGGSSENIGNFFAQLLFVGGSGAILVKTTMETLGYEVDFLKMAGIQVPIAVFAIALACVYYFIVDKKLQKKYRTKSK